MGRTFRDRRLYQRGRYIWARVRDEHGQIIRVTTRCTSEQAASAYADEYERKAADPHYRRSTETTLEGAISDYLVELGRRKVSEATLEIFATKAGHFVRLWGAQWPLVRIENDLVLRYIDRRESEGVTPLTIKKELGALKGMLEWARFRGSFSRDLATVLPPRYSGKHKPRTRWLPQQEAMRLLHQLTPRRAAHVAFILATGARRGESFRARREDVHLADANPHVYIRGSKTERSRGTVPVTGITHPFLVYALQHAPGKDVLFDPWDKMVRDLDSACERAKIAKCSANDLRRTYGKWHRLAGASAEQVSVMLRHATDTLAQTTYAQVSGADIGPAMRQLAPISSVSDLYAATAPRGPDSPDEPSKNEGKAVSPAGLGPAAPGLGNQGVAGASHAGKTASERVSDEVAATRIVPALYGHPDPSGNVPSWRSVVDAVDAIAARLPDEEEP